VESRDIGRAGVAEFAIDLVGEKEEVVFLDQVAELVHFFLRIEITRRVVGIADEDSLRAGRDKRFELLERRQRETFFNRRRNRLDNRAAGDGEGHVVGVGRFGDNQFVSGVEARHEGEEDRLGTACGDDNIVGIDNNIVLRIVFHQFFAETADTLAGRILQHCTVDAAHGFETAFRCRQVGLPDIEVIDLDTPLYGTVGQRNELPDRGSRHFESSF